MKIQINALDYIYPGEVTALEAVDLTIEPGSLTAILGPNGAGKTTLAKLISGLLKPGSGNVLLGDMDTSDHPAHVLAARAGYLFQNPDDQLFSKTVEKEVRFGPENLGFSHERIDRLVEESLNLTELDTEKLINPNELPSNKRRLCSLASILAMDTRCLILDEPTQGLDASGLSILTKIIRKLAKNGKSILIITHDLDFAAENMMDGIVLQAGKLLTHSPLYRIFSDSRLCRQCDIQIPQMVRLGQRLGFETVTLTPRQFVNTLYENRRI